jgi:flagellar basal body rod protein FlgG
MQADMSRLNTVAHNMANTTTTGYKRVFALSEGESAAPVIADPRQGALSHTGVDLNLAIEGNGFFLVSADGQDYVSRGGALRLDSRGRLVLAQSGLPIQGEGGEIFLQPGAFQVDGNGAITQGGSRVAQLRLVQAGKNARLEAAGNGLYRLKGGAAAPQEVEPGQVRQGYLEMSNVNSTREMVELMETTRHFESAQKAVQGMDAVWDKALSTLGQF